MEKEMADAKAMERYKIVAGIAAYYPGKFGHENAVAYCALLNDIEPELLNAAVKTLCAVNKWPPTVAEIRDEAAKKAGAVMGIEAPKASLAWEDVLKHIKTHGAYRRPRFSDPVCEETVRRMGWTELCAMSYDMTAVNRAQFFKVYNEIAADLKEEARLKKELGDNYRKAPVLRSANEDAPKRHAPALPCAGFTTAPSAYILQLLSGAMSTATDAPAKKEIDDKYN